MLYDIDKFKKYLNENSLKQTPERIDIAKAVVSFESIFTVDELIEKINTEGWPVSKATLYRSIPLLIKSGMIKPIATNHLHNHTFRRCLESDSDQSLDCVKCGNSLSLKEDIVHEINKELSGKYDFEEFIDSLLLLKGICPKCIPGVTKDLKHKHSESEKTTIRVLLFEDEGFCRSVISQYLIKKGYDVFAFSNPSELNKECKCKSDRSVVCADAIIVDIKMPGINGIEFVKKQIEKDCRIKNIAFVSAYWTLEDLDYAGMIGAAIFHKPFKLSELKNWLDRCVSDIPDGRILGDEFIAEASI